MGTTDNPKTKITAFKIRLADDKIGDYIALAPLATALEWLKEEMEAGDFCESYTIEPYETTQEELDDLPEFEGF